MQKHSARQFHIASIVVTVLFLFMGLLASNSVLAAKPPKDPPAVIDVREAFADQESGTLVLVGEISAAPVVRFGDDLIELSNITVTESVLTTDLPLNLIPGDYLVQITEGRTTESIMLTVGAVGPEGLPGGQGEIGPIGPQGEVGVAGPQGIAGPAGSDGAVGPTGLQGEVGPIGPQGEIGPQGTAGDSHWQLNGLKTYYTDGNVGIGMTDPQHPLHVETELAEGKAVYGRAASTSGYNYGVYGVSNSFQGRGVYGWATETGHGATSGVRGRSDSFSGSGVYGEATHRDGGTVGVHGVATSTSGRGVQGTANSNSGQTIGVLGHVQSPDGRGVFGIANSHTGLSRGVYGENISESGIGVEGRITSTTGVNYGVYGRTQSPDGFDFFAAGSGVDYGSASSRRWKSNIRNIDNPLGKVSQLRGVYYTWDEDHGGQHDVGFIAEEMGEVLPEIVQYEENGVDAIGLDYAKVTPLLVEAINALLARQEILEARIRELEGM